MTCKKLRVEMHHAPFRTTVQCGARCKNTPFTPQPFRVWCVVYALV
jgi:hypothetical protein